jgi:hypothetical protein
VALAVLARVNAVLAGVPGVEVRTSRSQVAFRRRRGFAYLWLPGRYLARPGADVVLSIVLDRRDRSARWKEVAHPAPTHWMHHLEARDAAAIDEQVARWLREACEQSA